jgi:hypothetical protein
MCLSFDGDFAQIEACFTKFMELARKQHIELQKFPGGSSLQFQPNDVMRSFSILKSYFDSSYEQTIFNIPEWITQVRFHLHDVLKDMEKASKDAFMTFFEQWKTIVSLAFTDRNIASGWRASGLFPLDYNVMLQRCTSWGSLSHSESTAIISRLPQLVEYCNTHGVCSDSAISDIFGESISTTIANMDKRTLIQQRALWLNKEDTLEMRKRTEEKRIEKRLKDQAVAEEKRLKALQKKVEQKVSDAMVQPVNKTTPIFFGIICRGSKSCRKFRLQGSAPEDDDQWRFCPVCETGCCGNKTCQASLNDHIQKCVLEQSQRAAIKMNPPPSQKSKRKVNTITNVQGASASVHTSPLSELSISSSVQLPRVSQNASSSSSSSSISIPLDTSSYSSATYSSTTLEVQSSTSSAVPSIISSTPSSTVVSSYANSFSPVPAATLPLLSNLVPGNTPATTTTTVPLTVNGRSRRSTKHNFIDILSPVTPSKSPAKSKQSTVESKRKKV